RFRNERRKASAIADAENVNSVRVDEIVILHCAKGRTISGQLRFEICFTAIAFAVPYSLFVHSEQGKFLELRETAKYQTAFVFRISRCFDRIAAQPTCDKDDRQFSFCTAR